MFAVVPEVDNDAAAAVALGPALARTVGSVMEDDTAPERIQGLTELKHQRY